MNYLKKYFERNNLISLLMAILLFIKCRPYFVWGWNDIHLTSLSIVITVFALINIDLNGKTRKLSFFILFTAYLLISLLRGAHLGAIMYISLAFIPFMKSDFFMKVYESFKGILCFVFILSIVSLILVVIGVQSPLGILDALNDMKSYAYIHYFMLVIPTHVEDVFARFCSVFDEPGVVGTMCSLILIAEGFKFKDKKIIVFLISGILSFSLFFYLIIIIYLFLRSNIKFKLLIIIAITLFYFATAGNDIFTDRIWGRLKIGGNGLIEGNNRNSDALIALWDKNKYSTGILWGYGLNMVKDYYESASIQLFILRDGLIFVLLYFYSYYLLNRSNHILFVRTIIYMVIMFLTLYQRPGFCDAEFSLLFTAIIINSTKYVSFDSHSKLQCGRLYS